MKSYSPKEVEAKWQAVWEETKVYEVKEDSAKSKIYATPMLPYPSGSGLHVGHVRNYSISDATARFYRQRGHNVMSNIGWDAFGLPAENYAIKTGTPPWESIATNTAQFKKQLKRLGMSYAWDREINTSDPEYYRWTQWVFLQLFNAGLAYQAESWQWWCPQCKTVLADEQVVAGKCWRHEDTDVIKKKLKQWFFKITDYADELLEATDDLAWPEHIKTMQKNWIGRSVGAEIDFQVDGHEEKISVFTTRADTIYGATFMVLAPEHPLVGQITTSENSDTVNKYIESTQKMDSVARLDEKRTKTGVFTGAYAINPASQEQIPIWTADYVMMDYGTGAIMAVPAHDERDWEFAKKFDLPIKQVFIPIEDDEINPPQTGMKDVRRDTVIVHLRDKSTGKFALLDWHESLEGITTAIMGGIEAGQTPEQAALSEIQEEAALGSARIVRISKLITGARYCASHKGENRTAIAYALLAEVDGLDQQASIDQKEQKLHDLVWVEEREVLSRLTPKHQKLIWQLIQSDQALLGEGEVINSGAYNGQATSDMRQKVVADLGKAGKGREKVNFRIHDWLISRQRYWGAPIPIIHCSKDGAVAVSESDLPVILPEVKEFAPTGETTSVLAGVESWVNVKCPKCGEPAKRETDTLDGYACSSWYMYRYCDPQNNKVAWDKAKVNYWFPVDFYFGGDHAVSHLLYFRFWHRFFVDKGLVSNTIAEPVKRLVYNGYINAADGSKMSKSKGNVVDPLDIIDSGYGADALRMFELFIGPYDQDVSWNESGVPGTYRFLQRVWKLVFEFKEGESSTTNGGKELLISQHTHRAIKKVTEDLVVFNFNTALAQLMQLTNQLNEVAKDYHPFEGSPAWRHALESLVAMLAPFAPHISEELWEELGYTQTVHISTWPIWDETLVKHDFVTIAVQVNGKLRATLEMSADVSEEEMITKARENEKVASFIQGDPDKVFTVKGKLVNFVVKT